MKVMQSCEVWFTERIGALFAAFIAILTQGTVINVLMSRY